MKRVTLNVTLTNDQIKQVEEMSKENEKKPQEPPVCKPNWTVGSVGIYRRHSSTESFRLAGHEYPTKETAKTAYETQRELAIINRLATELNLEDGFVPDWSDYEQSKFHAKYNSRLKMWEFVSCGWVQPLGVIVTSRKSAENTISMLNNKMVYGIER